MVNEWAETNIAEERWGGFFRDTLENTFKYERFFRQILDEHSEHQWREIRERFRVEGHLSNKLSSLFVRPYTGQPKHPVQDYWRLEVIKALQRQHPGWKVTYKEGWTGTEKNILDDGIQVKIRKGSE